jgi:hypothetical protein
VVISFVISEWLRHWQRIRIFHREFWWTNLIIRGHFLEQVVVSGNDLKCFLRNYKILVLIRFTWDRKCKALMKLVVL